jgi:5'-nucleotidase (lipoprotein e(P4) family)
MARSQVRVLSVAVIAVLWVGAGVRGRTPAADECPKIRDSHELLNPVLWVQTSAEYRAIASGLYRLAERQLDRALAESRWTAMPEQRERADLPLLEPAVILDVDETVLDNSPEAAARVTNRASYDPEAFDEWVRRGAADPIPGAIEFMKYALSRHVEVFLITNRIDDLKLKTLENLRKFDIALPSDRVLCKADRRASSDKSTRRSSVAARHRVLLLIGDDLSDFRSVTGARVCDRAALVKWYRGYWQNRWILLPNPAYGSWEQALLADLPENLTPEEKDRRQLEAKFEQLRLPPPQP